MYTRQPAALAAINAGRNRRRCPSGTVKSAGACYDRCDAGYKGKGPVCARRCSLYGPSWVDCGYGCAPDYPMCVKTTYRQAGAFSFFFFKVYLPGTGPFFDMAMKLGAFAAKLYRRVKPSKYRKRKDFAAIEADTMESRSMGATFLAAFGEPVRNESRTHVTLVPTHAKDKQAAFASFRASHSVMSQPIRKAARALVSAVRLLDTVVNVEDLAKYDPSGVLNMVVSFGHPMCRNDACVKCVTTRATPCIIAPTCVAGRCMNLGQKKDGSSCADFDWGGNSYTGHCQAGECVSKAVQSYYASRQKDKMWIPEGYVEPNVTVVVDPGVYSTSEREYIETSLGYWDELARGVGDVHVE
ncbi:hypothetical protein CLOM_g16443 [Closterium sp. NIES-68]|nr:hypothetical protein CLOM_g16443 [Closterium sp. NIES-68]